jgi:hypothetical protein
MPSFGGARRLVGGDNQYARPRLISISSYGAF